MKLGRNDPCHCGSGKKYKYCCYATDNQPHEDRVVVAAPDSAEPEESAESVETEEAGAESAAGKTSKSKSDREKGRERFHGSGKGKNANFKPRVFRGAQRGN